MAVSIRTPDDLVEMMLDVFAATTGLAVDRNPGSVIRTIFEAAALSDSEQFVQAAKASESFYLSTASGDDLDRRAGDYDISRLQPSKASTRVLFGDARVTTPVSTTLAGTASFGATFLTLASATGWSTSGFVILDRADPATRERLAFTRAGVVLTVPGTAFAHALGASAHVSIQGSDVSFAAGTMVEAPATENSLAVVFVTEASALIYDGDRFAVDYVAATAQNPGSAGNLAAMRITSFQTLPFNGAFISVSDVATGGVDLESDAAFRSRIRDTIRGLPRSTLVALASGLTGVTSGGVTISSAQVVEDTTPGSATVYIDDGSSYGIDEGVLVTPVVGYEVINSPTNTSLGDTRGRIINKPIAVLSGPYGLALHKSPTGATYKGSSGVAAGVVLSDAGKAWTVNAFAGWRVVDANGRMWWVISNTATALTLDTGSTPSSGPYALFNPTVFVSLPSPDWNISISTGDIEYVPGLEQYDVVVLGSGVTGYAYFYYGGIISEAQKVVNGDSLLPDKYPGLKAVGTQVLVRAPAVQTVLVSVAVIASAGVSVSSLIDPVKQAVIAYVNSRKVGEDLSVLRIGAAALGVSGVEDAAVLVPTGNVSVPDGYVAKTSISYITVS